MTVLLVGGQDFHPDRHLATCCGLMVVALELKLNDRDTSPETNDVLMLTKPGRMLGF